MRMIDENDLNAAVAANIIDRSNRPAREGPTKPARFSHIIWYAGALIIIGAMGLFTTLAFDAMGGKALTITALVYAAIATTLAHLLWHRPGLRVPAGLLIAVAVSMTPLAIFGVQASFDLWPTGFDEPGAYGAF